MASSSRASCAAPRCATQAATTIRLLKLNRYYDGASLLGRAVAESLRQLFVPLFMLLIMVFTFASIVYEIECATATSGSAPLPPLSTATLPTAPLATPPLQRLPSHRRRWVSAHSVLARVRRRAGGTRGLRDVLASGKNGASTPTSWLPVLRGLLGTATCATTSPT